MSWALLMGDGLTLLSPVIEYGLDGPLKLFSRDIHCHWNRSLPPLDQRLQDTEVCPVPMGTECHSLITLETEAWPDQIVEYPVAACSHGNLGLITLIMAICLVIQWPCTLYTCFLSITGWCIYKNVSSQESGVALLIRKEIILEEKLGWITDHCQDKEEE